MSQSSQLTSDGRLLMRCQIDGVEAYVAFDPQGNIIEHSHHIGDAETKPASPTLPPSTSTIGSESQSPTPPGPGTRLLKLLDFKGCSCNQRAKLMDEWGDTECLRRLDEIAGWLVDEAAKREIIRNTFFERQAATHFAKRVVLMAIGANSCDAS